MPLSGDRAAREGSIYQGHRTGQRGVDPIHDGEGAHLGGRHPGGEQRSCRLNLDQTGQVFSMLLISSVNRSRALTETAGK